MNTGGAVMGRAQDEVAFVREREVEFESVIRIDAVKDVDPSDWGKALLEDLLLKAAKAIASDETATGSVVVQLEFRISADADNRLLTISTPGEIETSLATHLSL